MSNAKLVRVIFAGLIASGLATASDEAGSKSSRWPRIRLGGLSVGAGYSSGPLWYPGYGYGGYYNPFWYGPFIHPGFYNGFVQQPDMGQVKLDAPAKGASVYVDGAYAGPAEKLKKFWLSPGVYNLEVRDNGRQPFRQKVYVLSGKTLAIRAELQPGAGGETR